MTVSNKTCFLFTQSYPFGKGEVFVEHEVSFLANYFKKVVIFPLDNTGDLRKLPINVEVRFLFDKMKQEFRPTLILKRHFYSFIKVMGSEFLSNPFLTLKNLKRLSSGLLQQFYRSILLEKELIKENCNEIVFYSYWFDSWVLVLTLVNKNIKIYTRAHGFDVFKNQTRQNYHPFKNRMFSKVDGVYSISKMGANYLRNQYTNFKFKIYYLYLGVSDNGTNPFANNNILHIVSCAHVRYIKRLHLAIDIFKSINISVKWTLIGNGEDLPKIKKLSKKLPPNIQCDFRGHLTQEQIMKFYASVPISLFMSLSRSEGLPFTMIEAISFGIPVISTNVGGCNEIVTSQTGILIPKNFESEKVAFQIEDFYQSDMNTERFRTGVKRFWKEHFDAENNYKEFYSKIEND